MDEVKKEQLMGKMIYSINDFKDEMVKSMNCIRKDMNYMRDDIKGLSKEVKELKSDVTALKSDVTALKGELKEFKEENNKRWEANDKKWEQYEENRKEDRKYLLDILTSYDISISERLGDPNVEKMRRIV